MRKVSATMSFNSRFTFSAQATRIYLEPPKKPPWQRFMDLNVDLAKLLKLKEAAKEIGKQVAWEIGKGILGLKRQPAERGKFDTYHLMGRGVGRRV